MRQTASSRVRLSVRFAALGLVAVSASACSSTDRFAYDPFSNPFSGKESPTYTGSVNSAPSGGVTSQPLPPPGGYQSSSYGGAPAYASTAQPSSPQPYRAPAPASDQQASYGTAPAAAPQPPAQTYPEVKQAGNWNAQGGKTAVVQHGDTAYTLGQRYGVPASSILTANNLPQGANLTPGQRLIIPAYQGSNGASAMAPKPAAPRPPVRSSAQTGDTHVVEAGETLFSIARARNVPAGQLASANGFGLDHRVRIGERVTIPASGAVQTQRAVAAAPAPEPMRAAPTPAPVQAAAPEPEAKFQRAVASTESKPAVSDEESEPQKSISTGGTDFRWPVRGRVISGFGSKPNGSTNDGLNLSVPEGTPIKAAEGGVVAYAGNELKGFGNLVLIRHAGEWVTAYAHASEILVKRGDVVRRGQVIAKSGKTGDVSAPQLHFEVRRGATPIDPMDHLPQG